MPAEGKKGLPLVALGLLIALAVFPALALGGAAPWIRSLCFLAALALVVVQVLEASRKGEIRVPSHPAWIFFLAYAAFGLLQLLPLPDGLLRLLSPSAAEVYGRAGEACPGARLPGTISLAPYFTAEAVRRLAVFGAVLFTAVTLVRRRWQVTALVTALILLGLFEALYGLADQYSGPQRIFWLPRIYHLDAVTGTFHNRNFFAALLAMIVPLALCSVFAAGRGPFRLSSRIFTAQLLLAAATVVMATAVLFSLSRGGFFAMAAALAAVGTLLITGRGGRRHLAVLAAVLCLAAALAASVGVDAMVGRVEDAVSGHSESWLHRLDIYRGGVKMAAAHPAFGTGLGTTAAVYPRFRSGQMGDATVLHLHSDWLETLTEGGIAGLALLGAGIALMLLSSVRTALGRRDPFCRWTALGAALGACAVLLHGFVEHSLSKTMSHGIVFSLLLGLSWSAANLGRTRDRRGRSLLGAVSLGRRGTRALAAAAALAAALALAPRPVAVLRADLLLNRHLAASGEADDYFFLPAAPSQSPAGDIERAAALDPHNPKILFRAGLQSYDAGESLVRTRAGEMAREMMGPALSGQDRILLEDLTRTFSADLREVMKGERRPFLESALMRFERAVEEAPTVAPPHIHRAAALGELVPGDPGALAEAALAVWLSPAVPSVLYNAGRLLLLASYAAGSGGESRRLREEATRLFRRALAVEPAYAAHIYPIVETLPGGWKGLADVTPPSLKAREELYDSHRRARRWDEALLCLDGILELAERRSAAAGPVRAADALFYAPVDAGYDPRSLEEIRVSVARRRVRLAGLRGLREEWHREAALYGEVARPGAERELLRLRRMRESGRSAAALDGGLRLLESDWSRPLPFLEAIETVSLPAARRRAGGTSRPVDLLTRMVAAVDSLDPGQGDRLRRAVKALERGRALDGEASKFFLGAAELLSGDSAAAVPLLEDAAAGGEPRGQDHLAWLFLARAYADAGRSREAAESYRRVLDLVPAHDSARRELASLEGRDWPAPVPPAGTVLDADFGGLVTLLGYSFSPPGGASAGMRWFWRIDGPLPEGCRATIHFRDAGMEYLFNRDQDLCAAASLPGGAPPVGAVVTLDTPLPAEFARARYLGAGVSTGTESERGAPLNLLHQGGEQYLLTSLGVRR